MHPAEQFCLSREGASPNDVLQLISLLDSELPSRGQLSKHFFLDFRCVCQGSLEKAQETFEFFSSLYALAL